MVVILKWWVNNMNHTCEHCGMELARKYFWISENEYHSGYSVKLCWKCFDKIESNQELMDSLLFLYRHNYYGIGEVKKIYVRLRTK